MSKNRQELAKAARGQQIELLDEDNLLGVYADVFLVASSEQAGIVSLSFYQTMVPTKSIESTGTKTQLRNGPQQAQMVARILLAPPGLEVLLQALRENKMPKIEDKKDGGAVAA